MLSNTDTIDTDRAAETGNGKGKRLDVQALVLSSAVRRRFPTLKPLEMAVLQCIADYPFARGSEVAGLCGCCAQTVSTIRNEDWFEEALITLGLEREPLFAADGRALKQLILKLIGRRAAKAALKEDEFEPTANELTFLRGCGVLNPDAHLHLHAPAGSENGDRLDSILKGFLEPFTPENREQTQQAVELQVVEAE